MSRQAAEVGPPESEYMTVPEIAKILRRNRKTVYDWIESGGIGKVDGLFVVQGRYLIHWPTFRTRQFNPARNYEVNCRNTRRNRKIAWLETDRHRRLRIGFK